MRHKVSGRARVLAARERLAEAAPVDSWKEDREFWKSAALAVAATEEAKSPRTAIDWADELLAAYQKRWKR